MEYLNIPVCVLDSSEFIGADQIERGTWLCLQRYCIGQENSGVIDDCAKWKDRQWQQVCRVTLREVRRESRLFRWEGFNLRVFYYPQDSEDQVKAKRLVAKANGKMGGRPLKNPAETQPKPTLVIFEKAKGKEKKGKEIDIDPAPFFDESLCSLEQAIGYGPTVRLTPAQAEHWWHVRNSSGWTKGSTGGGTARKITSWQSDMATSISWIGESLEKGKQAVNASRGETNCKLKQWEQ